MPNHQTTWVLVANSSHAKLFQVVRFPQIKPIHVFSHPESRLHEQDLVSSRPGRAFDSLGEGRHAYETKTSPKQIEFAKFSKELADFLNKAYQNKEFFRLYLIASPLFLGVLRQELSSGTKGAIVEEIHKDLTDHTTEAIEGHLIP